MVTLPSSATVAPPLQSTVASAVETLLADVRAALPSLVAAVVFVLLATVGIRLVSLLVRAVIVRALPGEEVYAQFVGTVVSALLWFAAALTVLSLVGLGEIAAALGTASGFVALGVSYALSGMIADAVAGVYLLRDPDFSPGDEVTVGDTSGTVDRIELRKTRFAVDGDTVVRANAEIEKRWTKRSE